jgi:hypothetical protein
MPIRVLGRDEKRAVVGSKSLPSAQGSLAKRELNLGWIDPGFAKARLNIIRKQKLNNAFLSIWFSERAYDDLQVSVRQ